MQTPTHLDAKQQLEQALWNFHKVQTFSGFLIQEMSINSGNSVPTAALKYNKETNEFEIIVNPDFFAKCSALERVAILEHEMLHFTTKHIFRFLNFSEKEKKDPSLHNVAMDISINQYINNLPKDSLYPEMFKTIDNKPLPKWATYEEYYSLIKPTMPESKGGSRDNAEASDSPHQNEEVLNKFGILDEHDFCDLNEEEKRRMLQKGSQIVKRTIDKMSDGQSKEKRKDEYKELLNFLDHQLKKFNTKALFKLAIRQSVVRSEREGTWNRPNKRFGYAAPGSRQAKVPCLDVYCDTSGSMSITELSRFMSVLFRLCGSSAPTCSLSLWHTDLYHSMKFSKRTRFNDIPWQSGGTDCTDVAKKVNEKDSDLTIVMTDGYYTTDTPFKKTNVVWLISEKGGLNHPCKNIGKTFLLEDLLNG